MWTDEQLQFLINERKANNEYYHDLTGGGRKMFWKNVVSRINLQFGTKFSGQQAKEKFQGLVRDYHVSKNICLTFCNTLFLSVD